MNKLIFGRYIPGDSVVHHMDPREILLSFHWDYFIANNWATYALLFVFTLAAIYLSGVKWSFFINGVKPLIWLILFTVILKCCLVQVAARLLQWGIITISQLGLISRVYIFAGSC